MQLIYPPLECVYVHACVHVGGVDLGATDAICYKWLLSLGLSNILPLKKKPAVACYEADYWRLILDQHSCIASKYLDTVTYFLSGLMSAHVLLRFTMHCALPSSRTERGHVTYLRNSPWTSPLHKHSPVESLWFTQPSGRTRRTNSLKPKFILRGCITKTISILQILPST